MSFVVRLWRKGWQGSQSPGHQQLGESHSLQQINGNTGSSNGINSHATLAGNSPSIPPASSDNSAVGLISPGGTPTRGARPFPGSGFNNTQFATPHHQFLGGWYPYILVLLQTLKIQSLKQWTPWRSHAEQPKVAIHQDRSLALVRNWIHLIPLGATIFLVVINCKTTIAPAGLSSDNTQSALQFAAKGLEMWMQASLADIYLHFVRNAMLGDKGLPLGFLVGPLQTTSPMYLLSHEFLGSVCAGGLGLARRLRFLVLTFTLVVSAILVGPSSAVLLIPRSLVWDHGAYVVVLEETQSLFPQQVGLANIQTQFYPGEAAVNLSMSLFGRELESSARQRRVFDIVDTFGIRGAYVDNLTQSVTMPMAISALSMNFELPGLSPSLGTLTASVHQPLVRTDCLRNRYNLGDITGQEWIIFPGNESELSRVANIQNFLVGANLPFDGLLDRRRIYATNAPNTSNGSAHSALLMLNSGHDGFITACVVDAFWLPTESNYTQITGVSNSNPDDLFNIPPFRPISVDPDLIMNMTRSYDASYGIDVEFSGFSPDSSFAIAYGISLTIPSDYFGYQQLLPDQPNIFDSFTDDQKSSLNRTIHEKHLGAKYGYYVGLNNFTDSTNLTYLEIHLLVVESGYSIDSITVKLSLAMIAFYILVVGLYLCFAVVSGQTGTSWGTAGELLMLAINTPSPGTFPNTSAGVETNGTFGVLANIRFNTEGSRSLEIVFHDAGRQPARGLDIVVPNEKY